MGMKFAPQLSVVCVRVCCLSVAVLFLFCGGCGDGGPPKYKISGKVTYKQKIIPTGSVTFAPKGGGDLIVVAISDEGEYQLEAPAGEYEVAVAAIGEVADGVEGFKQMTPRPLLPDRFSYPARSGIVVTVVETELNAIDLSLPIKR